MSRSLEDLLEFDYFPYYTKEELLEKVKTWFHPESAAEYVRAHYDLSNKMRKRSEELFKSGKSFNEISKIMDEEFPTSPYIPCEGIPSTIALEPWASVCEHKSGISGKIAIKGKPQKKRIGGQILHHLKKRENERS